MVSALIEYYRCVTLDDGPVLKPGIALIDVPFIDEEIADKENDGDWYISA